MLKYWHVSVCSDASECVFTTVSFLMMVILSSVNYTKACCAIYLLCKAVFEFKLQFFLCKNAHFFIHLHDEQWNCSSYLNQ